MGINSKEFGLLTGGLGNQLFQYSFLLSRAKQNNFLVTHWGKPRLNNLGDPEIASFTLDSQCSLIQPKVDSLIVRKSIGYSLRSGYSPKKWESRTVQYLIQVLVSIQVSLGLRRLIIAKAHKALGYAAIKGSRLTHMNIGYYQSYKWADDPKVFSKLMNLKLINSRKIHDLQVESKKKKPVVVHFRFGDYLAEEDFGIPSMNYYKEAVALINQESSAPRLFWVFSDDIIKAKEISKEIGIEDPRCFTSDEFSPSETLEVMRLGTDFIIANSTFSWWAAFLRHERDGIVVAPTPWFKGMDSPQELIPPDWIQLPAHF